MSRRRKVLALCGAAACSPLSWSQPKPSNGTAPATAPAPDIKPLGVDRYQVGKVVVDKAQRRFTLPGRIHLLGQPLEYLASVPGGRKAYETLLEVEATGTEFNLACILIGLERDPALPRFHKSNPQVLKGPRVKITLAWTVDGKRKEMSAAHALFNPEAGVKPETVEWVYTGAPTDGYSGNAFTPDVVGALIGFVQDPNTLIESSFGIGLGAYGSVRGNPALPPPGTAIEMVVEAVTANR